MKNKQMPLVVTTQYKGVFFGYGVPTAHKVIRMTKVRMCIYYSSDTKGVMGLAAQGPSALCKVSPSVPAFTIQDVTGIMEASPEAAKAWESGPWAN